MKIKIPFWLEKKINKVLKPLLVTEVRIYVDDKLKRQFYGKSLTANYLQWLYSRFNGFAASANWAASAAPFTSNLDLINTAGVDATSGLYNYPIMTGLTGDDTRGFLIGTGTTTPTPQDYVIESIIPNGTAVGQMSYNQMICLNGVTILGSVSSLIVQRTFDNNSGATINVSEFVMYGDSSSLQFLFYRDTFTPISVVDGKTFKIEIEFSVTT